jgi:GntR family transcriptional repressor for pyruvate dehydrogenase complex
LIQEEIFQGRLQPGDRLPGERELSEALGVSRSSTREALRVLEALEIVRVRPGTGPDAGSIVLREPGNGIVNLLRVHVALRHFLVDDVVEARILMEGWTAGMAAARATADDLDRLRKLLKGMDDPDIDIYTFNELDTEFHIGVATASANPLIGYLFQAIRLAIQQRMVEGFEQVEDWPTTASRLRAEHWEVFRAIASGNVEAASEAVRQHIERFYREIGREPDVSE